MSLPLTLTLTLSGSWPRDLGLGLALAFGLVALLARVLVFLSDYDVCVCDVCVCNELRSEIACPSLHAPSTPYKMSKSIGNVIEPTTILNGGETPPKTL
jgi:hypothetical protein